ncbi:hypothetical protein [Oceanisphaera avium]|uniref:Uncharacterized protein n=1 Tax=Oceanisphaera avium TaxID=1903694 RepID=A0A1Y0D054_9GAMM|nr:hypothetical protein [Oceanisphaera avium]ART80395.1 hypothetical protein CBP12_09785 [Oceanisphaera avium]
MLAIILLGLVIAGVLLLLNQGRSHSDITQRVFALEAQNQQLQDRVQALEALVIEKEKHRPFDAL